MADINYKVAKHEDVTALQEEVTAQLSAIDTQLAERADKLKATNLITNGDFSTGPTGWTGSYGELTSGVNELIYTVIAGNNVARINAITIPTIVGHVYYMRGEIIPKYLTSATLRIGGTSVPVAITTTEDWNVCIGIATAVAIDTEFRFYHSTATNYNAGDIIKFRFITTIDLTAAFGAGKEPSKEEMDRLLDEFPNSWFDGAKEVLPLKTINKILGEKANKVQEDWITPTLLNGWVNYNVDYSHVGYFKDSLGFVHLRGMVKSGSSGVIFTLPVGYRPSGYEFFLTGTALTTGTQLGAGFYINSNGDVRTYNVGSSAVYLSGIKVRAV